MEWINNYTIFIVMHLIGVALGAGGAYSSDWIFFSSVKDGKVTSTELRFIKLGSLVVWTGVLLLLISGIGLFISDPSYYISSDRFLAKMSIVGILLVNGIVFHFSHLPRLSKHVNTSLSSSADFVNKLPFLALSGAVSFISWTSAIILGIARDINNSYTEIMGLYLSLIFIASLASILIVKNHPALDLKTKKSK